MAKELKSIITDYLDICAICGRPRSDIHHILEGVGKRHLSDSDKLLLPLCIAHHNQSGLSVHQNKEMKVLCHIIGELAWEREYLADRLEKYEPNGKEESKIAFHRRYGQNYI